MIEQFGDWASFFSGFALLAMAALVMVAYRPRGPRTKDAAATTLAMAIFLGFAAHAGNTLYWQVFGQPAVTYGLVTVEQLRLWGDWADVLFKGGAALSAWMHLVALHMYLDPEEKKLWRVLEMPWYPKRRACLSRLFRRINRSE
jgi:hypothetical protein